MGIKGLLPMLGDYLIKNRITKYKSKRVAIDGFVWLYKYSASYAEELYLTKTTSKHIPVFIAKVKGLIRHNIIPVVVFDGESPEIKMYTSEKRKARKEAIIVDIERLLKDKRSVEARLKMRSCIEITAEMVDGLIIALRASNIETIQAPYEADAQLTYLQNIGYVDYILSEDSDYIVFGCTRILYKYDGATVMEFNREKFILKHDPLLVNNLREIIILSGCDYFEGIKGVGLITAIKLFKEYGTFESILKYLNQTLKINQDCIINIFDAYRAFDHQVVYDPIHKRRVHLKPLPKDLGVDRQVKFGYLDCLEAGG